MQCKILQEKLKADNKLDCAGKCLWKKKHEYQCNAYEYTHDDHSCNLAIIDFLEDPGPQETAQKFYVEYQQIKNLSMTCRGGMGKYSSRYTYIYIRVGGRAENCVLGDGRSHKSTVLRDGRPRKKSTVFEDRRVHGRPSLNTVLFSPPARPSTHSVALFLATFWPLLARWSRVRQNDLYHRFRLGQTELLSPTCKIATGSL